MPCYYPLRLAHLEHAVPCGRCIGCRLERSRQWAVRMVNEANLHEKNCFITLTYNDNSLPVSLGGGGNPTLLPRDLQLFIKRLRKKYGTGIKYFACGEYGSKTQRPHYHACLFNLDFCDKIPYKKTGENILYTSKILDEIWGFGNCIIGDFSFDSAAYVARYCVEKLNGAAAIYYDEQAIEPEFARMSLKPAIGKAHFDKYKSDIYPYDTCVINSVKSKPSRYYDKLLKSVNINMYESVKLNRKLKSNVISIYEKMPKRLAVKERVALSKLKSKSVL